MRESRSKRRGEGSRDIREKMWQGFSLLYVPLRRKEEAGYEEERKE